MVDSQDTTKKRKLKKPQTVRERAEKAGVVKKPRRIRKAGIVVAKPFKAASTIGSKEYYLPLPDNKIGQFLNKRRRFIPAYFRNSFSELRNVVWPNRKETAKLTMAVFLFAFFFGSLITVADYGLDKIFKNFILK